MLLHDRFVASSLAVVLALAVLSIGCNGGGEVDPDGNRNVPRSAAFDADGLARDLLGDDVTRRDAAVNEVAAASRENQQRVTVALDSRALLPDVSAELARRAADAGRHRMAAEWYAWPQSPPADDAARVDRRLLAIEQLIEAGEIGLALELCDSRLLGDYPPATEARFTALRERALARAE